MDWLQKDPDEIMFDDAYIDTNNELTEAYTVVNIPADARKEHKASKIKVDTGARATFYHYASANIFFLDTLMGKATPPFCSWEHLSHSIQQHADTIT